MREQVVLERNDLNGLFTVLKVQGYTVIGPTIRDGGIVYDEWTVASDFSEGWTDEPDGGVSRRYHVVGSYSSGRFANFLVTEIYKIQNWNKQELLGNGKEDG